MRKKLLITYITIIGITLFITMILSWNKVNSYFYNQVDSESIMQSQLLEKILLLELDKTDFDFQEFALNYGEETRLRITLIDMDGWVLGDSSSDPETLENHKLRPEVISALNGRADRSLRFSETVRSYSYYYATPISHTEFQGVLRISIPAVNIQNLIWDMANSLLFAVIIGIGLSMLTAFFFTKRFMEPIDQLTSVAKQISSGNYDVKAYVDKADQIGELADAFNTMTYVLRENIFDIASRNAELEAILKSMDIGLVAVDDNYKIMLCNEAFKKILNIEKDPVGKVFYEITRNTQLFEVIEQSIDNDEFVSKEARYTEESIDKYLKISSTPVKSQVIFKPSSKALILVEDVTGIKKLESIRRTFVSNVTHELKTPLTSIHGFAEILQQGALDEPELARRYLTIIDIETERLASLIDDILTLSEIETMGMDKTSDVCVVQEVVDEVLDLLKMKLEQKDIQLVVDVQLDLPNYIGNRYRLKQIFINLIDNSIKYTEVGSIKVECKQSIDKKYLQINIIDTGIGIKEEHLEHLFERFYRVDKGRSRKQGGTGLGLSIVKHIVELYHGSIKVSSKFGEGTTMKVKLPYSLFK